MMLKRIGIFALITLFLSKAVYAELKDPTRPPGYINGTTTAISTWELDAVIISKERTVAIINGEVVKVGDQIAGNRLVSIGPYSVQLESGDGKITLFLLDSSLKIE
jgi:MSHA biogenesis protein MshK